MGVTIFRPGQRLVIPAPNVQVWTPRTASAAASTWWDNNGAISGCICAYAPKGAADLASSYVNLANPGTYDAAPGVAPTWDSTGGWTFNGSTQYLTTGITPANDQTWSIIVRFSNVPGSGSHVLIGSSGAGPTPPYFGLIPRWTDGNSYYSNGSGLAKTAKTSGVMAFAGANAYFNGSAETGTIPSDTGTSRALTIGARNQNGTLFAYANCKIQAIAIYSTTLTAGEVATITTAMQAL